MLDHSHQCELRLEKPAIEAVREIPGHLLVPDRIFLLPLFLLFADSFGDVGICLVHKSLQLTVTAVFTELPLLHQLAHVVRLMSVFTEVLLLSCVGFTVVLRAHEGHLRCEDVQHGFELSALGANDVLLGLVDLQDCFHVRGRVERKIGPNIELLIKERHGLFIHQESVCLMRDKDKVFREVDEGVGVERVDHFLVHLLKEALGDAQFIFRRGALFVIEH